MVILEIFLNVFWKKEKEDEETVELKKAVQPFHQNSHALHYSLRINTDFEFASDLHKISV